MNITVTPRGHQSKGERKKRLRQGFIPASIYGKGVDPVLVEVPAKAIAGVLMAETALNTIIDLTVTGDKKKHTVLVDNLDRDPITRNFIHVGFHQVKKGDKVTAHIPIQLIGTPSDVELNGALLDHLLDSIEVHADPTDLPAHIDVDVSNMKVGDVLTVAALPHNAKLQFVTHEDVAIAAVHVSKTAQEAEAIDEAQAETAAAVAAAEPVAAEDDATAATETEA